MGDRRCVFLCHYLDVINGFYMPRKLHYGNTAGSLLCVTAAGKARFTWTSVLNKLRLTKLQYELRNSFTYNATNKFVKVSTVLYFFLSAEVLLTCSSLSTYRPSFWDSMVSGFVVLDGRLR